MKTIVAALASSLLLVVPLAAQGPTPDPVGAEFRDRVRAAFDLDPASIHDDAVVLVTRTLAAQLIATTLNRSDVGLTYTLPKASSFVPDPFELRTEKKADASAECSPDQWCNYGCDSPLPWEKAGCELDKWTCKSGRKLDCERRKTMAQAISDKKVATVSFKEVDVAGGASAAHVNVTVAPGLDHLAVRADLAASIRMSCSGYVEPEPLITVVAACVKHEFHFIDEPVDMAASDFLVESDLELSADGDKVVLEMHPKKPRVTLRFAGTPALRFIARNPLAFVGCAIPYALAGLSNLTHPNDTAKREVELPVPAASVALGAVTRPLTAGWAVTARPFVSGKALGVMANATAKAGG